MNLKFYTKYILIIIQSALFIGCSSSNKCSNYSSNGNAGNVINTVDDEYLPIIYNNKLYYTQVENKKINIPNSQRIENTYFASINPNGSFNPPQKDKVLPTNQIEQSGSPTFYFNKDKQILEIYFAGKSQKDRLDKDIYYAIYTKNSWSAPKSISENINTASYESHPYISQDGKYIIFTSDREGGLGETDLYISYRNESGDWSNAINLGNQINTAGREIAPFISSDGTLYYSSDGFMNQTGLDIIKAERISDNNWGNPIILNPPINSEFNEIGPAMYKNKIIFSSNRKNSCGGYDIYSFDLCNNALISGKIGGIKSPKMNNKITLFDEFDNIIEEKKLSNGSNYSFDLTPNKSYKIVFQSTCNDADQIYEFSVPCSDSNIINYVANFDVMKESSSFSLEDYKIPFFVSGYYRPILENHLEALKMKFLQNLFGNSDSTRYIENPGNKYDEYSKEVDNAINTATDFIISRLKSFEDACMNTNTKIKIEIRGYSDPRGISNYAKYADETISDERLNFKVIRGENMNNLLLSKLRAYFTFITLEDKLKENEIYLQNLNKIKWKIIGEGEDSETNIEDIQKRRVSMNITLINED